MTLAKGDMVMGEGGGYWRYQCEGRDRIGTNNDRKMRAFLRKGICVI